MNCFRNPSQSTTVECWLCVGVGGMNMSSSILLVLVTSAWCYEFNEYTHSAMVMDGYRIHWRMSSTDSKSVRAPNHHKDIANMAEEQKEGHIHLALEVETTGWVGFGIAESGGMAGNMGNLLCTSYHSTLLAEPCVLDRGGHCDCCCARQWRSRGRRPLWHG